MESGAESDIADALICRLISFEEFIEFVQKRVRPLASATVCQ